MSAINKKKRQLVGLGLALTVMLSGLVAVALTHRRLASFAGSDASVRPQPEKQDQPRAGLGENGGAAVTAASRRTTRSGS